MADIKKSRIGLYIIVGLGILVVGTVIYLLTKGGPKCDPSRNGFDSTGNPNPKCQFNNPSTTGEPSPAGTSGWVSDSTFPIKKGSWGPKVAALQTAIGVGSDGKFGSDTEKNLIAKTGKAEVSNASDYDKIINPPTTAGGSNFQQLKDALKGASQNFKDGILYVVQGQNKLYQFDFYASNGRFFVSEKGKNVALKKGTYSNGGKTMKIDGGPQYNLSPIQNMQNIINYVEE